MDFDVRERKTPSPLADFPLQPKQHRVSRSFELLRVQRQIVIQRNTRDFARLQEGDRFLWSAGANPARRSLPKIVKKNSHLPPSPNCLLRSSGGPLLGVQLGPQSLELQSPPSSVSAVAGLPQPSVNSTKHDRWMQSRRRRTAGHAGVHSVPATGSSATFRARFE